MGWLYNVVLGEDVFVIKIQVDLGCPNSVSSTDVFWFDSKEKVWRVSPLNRFRPPKENH